MLLMAFPNEHLMTFNQYKDAKSLFDAITTRLGGNDATRKTRKTLLKQMYENFSAQRTEFIDSIFNRLRKIVSQLAVLGESISQEDLNLKFLRILPSKWNTHVVVWRNKLDLEKISIDDLYNNFKIIEQEVKRNAGTSSSSGSQNMAFVSTPSTSNNDDVSTVFRVSTASPQVSTANLSDVTVMLYGAFCKRMQSARELGEQKHESRNHKKDRVEDTSSKYAELRVEFNKSEFDLANYKRGLASVEKQLVHYKKNESLLNENIIVLKRDILIKDSEIVVLKSKLEKISKEKDDIEIKIEKFENASQSLDKLIGSQITDKSKKGLGYLSYNAIPHPHTRKFSSLRIDLSHTGLPEFAEPSVESYGVKPIKVVTKTSSVKISEHVKENYDAPLIEDWESEGEDEDESPPEIERKIVEPSVDKVEVDIPKQNDKLARRLIKYTEMYRTQRPRGKQRNWNNLKSHQLEEKMVNETNHSRVNHSVNRVPKAVLTKTDLKPVNTVRPFNPKSTR
nr:hypothetical protein [Tanacetum cinerariifolium]